MTDGYDCYQNALAGRVNGILKGGLPTSIPHDLAQAATMIAEECLSATTNRYIGP